MLALLIIVSAFVSCGGEKGDQAPEITTTIETSPAETEDPEPDNLPEKDFGGYEFKLYCRSCCTSHKDGLWQAESMGDVVNDSFLTKKKLRRDCRIIAEPLLSERRRATGIACGRLHG